MLDHQRDDVATARGATSSCSNSSAIRSRDSAIRSLARVGAGVEPRRIGRVAEPRVEAEEAQDAQMILGDALQRIADEADAPRLQIVDAAEIVEQSRRSPDRHRAR